MSRPDREDGEDRRDRHADGDVRVALLESTGAAEASDRFVIEAAGGVNRIGVVETGG